MFFWLKKLIGYWILPVPLCLALLLGGTILLCTTRKRRLGRNIVIAGVGLLALLSNKYVSAGLIRPLETAYPSVPELRQAQATPELTTCRYVAVLGAGNGNTPGVAALNQLSGSGRARITEAARLLRAVPTAQLILTGPGYNGLPSHATVLEQAAISLGVEPQRIVRIDHGRDTEDEANAVAAYAGSARVAVVTSAWHMPRSMALFRGAGANALACPTDYLSHDDGRFHWRDLLWDVESIERSSFAIRERVGQLWIQLRGKAG